MTTKYSNQNILYGFICILCFICGIFFFIPLTHADIYIYIDSDGVIHFTNTPTASGYKLYMRESHPIFPPEPLTEKFDPLISEASKRHDVDFSLLKALIKVESDFNPWAVSRTGAKGLMQIMPDNIKALRINNPFDPEENIMGGSRYLKRLLKRFENQVPLALAAYNAGPSAVERYKRIPPFRETENYVKKVMKQYHILNKE